MPPQKYIPKATILDPFPGLRAHHQRVHDLPALKAYYAAHPMRQDEGR